MFKKIIIIALLALTVLFFTNNLSAEPTSPETQTSYVDTFNQTDSNQDGYLSSDEASKAELLDAEGFKKADTDSDNLLSLREAKQINLQPPKVVEKTVEEEKPVVQAQEETPVTQTTQVQEPEQIPQEIKKEQEKLGVALPKETPAVKAKPRIPARQASGPARSIQTQKGSYQPKSIVGAPGNVMPPQKAGRIPRRPPSFIGRRIPKPPTTTAPTTAPAQPQPNTSNN